MRVNVTYTDEMIKKLITADLQRKLSKDSISYKAEIEVKVRSKQNYREKDWERGELKVELELEIEQ